MRYSSSAVALAEDSREIEEEDISSNYDIVDDSSSEVDNRNS
jgi:hypothetical protein